MGGVAGAVYRIVVPDPGMAVKVPDPVVLPVSEASSKLHSGRPRLLETVPVKTMVALMGSETMRGEILTER
jgi:hypothetical protein